MKKTLLDILMILFLLGGVVTWIAILITLAVKAATGGIGF